MRSVPTAGTKRPNGWDKVSQWVGHLAFVTDKCT